MSWNLHHEVLRAAAVDDLIIINNNFHNYKY